jgi:hypothetical protein
MSRVAQLAVAVVACIATPGALAKVAPRPAPSPTAPAPTPPATQTPSQTQQQANPVDEEEDDGDDDAGLPQPPSIAPVEYNRWLKSLRSGQRRAIDQFCRANPVEYKKVCGGIGPLHIPVPPSLMPMREKPGAPPNPNARPAISHDDWKRGLTTAQRQYYQRYCRTERWAFSRLCGATPLAVAFEGQPVAYSQEPGRFAFRPGDPVATDWPTAATPWLALDRDGDGAIASGAELFGGDTQLPDGATARHGFIALAALDANGDKTIDAADPEFARLVLWADRDGDRKSTPDELVRASTTIVSISLAYWIDVRCDARINCERERATLRWLDASGGVREGAIVDVYLAYR